MYAAADYCIIPVQSHFLASEGIPDVLDMVRAVRQKFNPRLQIAGILLTMYQSRPQLCRSVRESVEDVYGEALRVFGRLIEYSIKVAECPAAGKSILDYAPKNAAADSYRSLAQEVMQLAEEGLLERIIVRRITGSDFYEIFAGHNRTETWRMAGHNTISAEIVDADDEGPSLSQQRPICCVDRISRSLNAARHTRLCWMLKSVRAHTDGYGDLSLFLFQFAQLLWQGQLCCPLKQKFFHIRVIWTSRLGMKRDLPQNSLILRQVLLN